MHSTGLDVESVYWVNRSFLYAGEVKIFFIKVKFLEKVPFDSHIKEIT